VYGFNEKYDEVYFFVKNKTKEALIANGITYYFADGIDKSLKEKTITTIHPVKILDNLEEK
jgi:hypothetical protein